MANEEQQNQQPETGTAPEKEQEQGEQQERTFTQAELDRIVKDRLARENGKFADYDDLKTKAARLDEIEEANKTELEKAQEDARRAREELDNQRQKAAKAEREKLIVETASALNFTNVDDAVKLVGDAEDVAGELKKLAEEKPYLLKQDKRPPQLRANKGGDRESEGNPFFNETAEERRKRLLG